MEETAKKFFEIYKKNEIEDYELCYREFQQKWLRFLQIYIKLTTDKLKTNGIFSFVNSFENHCGLRRYCQWLNECLNETNQFSKDDRIYYENPTCKSIVQGDLIYEEFKVNIFVCSQIN